MALIPAVLVFIQAIGDVFGYGLDFTEVGDRLAAVIEAAFALLAVLGVVVDPTTEGIEDSTLAMTYKEPKKKYDTFTT